MKALHCRTSLQWALPLAKSQTQQTTHPKKYDFFVILLF